VSREVFFISWGVGLVLSPVPFGIYGISTCGAFMDRELIWPGSVPSEASGSPKTDNGNCGRFAQCHVKTVKS
jgi:hypothetical protein